MRMNVEGRKLTRRGFLKLGAAGIVGLTGGFRHPAYAATTTAYLSSFCDGDGSDETDAIQEVVDNHDRIVFDAAPGGVGYGINPARGGIRFSGPKDFVGHGEAGKAIRLGTFKNGSRMFQNKNRDTGDDGVRFLEDFVIDGKKGEVEDLVQKNNSIAIAILADGYEGRSHGFEIDGLTIVDYPGTAVRTHNCADWDHRNVYFNRNHRGGLIYGGKCRNGTIRDADILHGGDDAIAFNSREGDLNYDIGGPASQVTVARCRLQVKPGENGGCPLAIRGGVDVEAWELVTRGGVNAGILIGERKDEHPTKDISINGEKGGKRIRVNAPDGSGVNVLRQVESTYLYSVTVHRPSDEPAFRIRSNDVETKNLVVKEC